MKVAIASGKGGVGKTTVAVNLAKSHSSNTILLDCDVEEPNCHLFLQGKITAKQDVFVPVPQIDEKLCSHCGECSRFCEYNAIVSSGAYPLVFAEMCHSCGGCLKVCPHNAIFEIKHKIGVVEKRKINKIELISGILEVGKIMSPSLIKAVKKQTTSDVLTIIDAPPGVSCSVVASIFDADIIILVTEPTPFGLNDLSLAVTMLQKMQKPMGVVINRMVSGNRIIHNFCEANNLKIWAEIPEDINIAQNYSKGRIVVDEMPCYQNIFMNLFKEIALWKN